MHGEDSIVAAGSKDYYQILGVSREATEKEIKQAYRRLARKHHPDVSKNDAGAEARFREINEAYSVLSDKDKRAKYDQFGPYWEQAAQAGQGPFGGGGFRGGQGSVNYQDLNDLFQGFSRGGGGGGRGHAGSPFGDIFSSIFGGGGGGGTGWPGSRGGVAEEAGREPEANLDLTIEEAVGGAERSIQVQRDDRCPLCQGAGRRGRARCPECQGQGVVIVPRRLNVKVPKGVREGTRIRVKGEGGTGPGGEPRDLYLVVKLAPHPVYEVKGADLHRDIPLSVTEAVLGTRIQFSTLRGTATMTIPAGTQGDQVFRLSGQGLPAAGSNAAGDLYVKARIVVPRNLSEEEHRLYERLAQLRPDSPRESSGEGRG